MLHISLVIGRGLAKNMSALGQICDEVASEDATLHEMLSTETESGTYFLALFVQAWRRLSTFLIPMLRDGWRKVKIFRHHELPKTLWL